MAKLTHEQAEIIRERLGPQLDYLTRLVERMEELRFPPDDRLLQVTRETRNAVRALMMEVHYSGCHGGVGR